MTIYVALLRGVNLIGKSTLKMADLKTIAEDSGSERVRTHIASGNLLFASALAEDAAQSKLQSRLQAHMGKQVGVMVRTADEMSAIVEANPFGDAPGNRVQVFFMNERPPVDLLTTVRNQADDERIGMGQREVYVAYGEKGIGRSRLRIPAAEAGTARNMNTVTKLAELAREMK